MCWFLSKVYFLFVQEFHEPRFESPTTNMTESPGLRAELHRYQSSETPALMLNDKQIRTKTISKTLDITQCIQNKSSLYKPRRRRENSLLKTEKDVVYF